MTLTGRLRRWREVREQLMGSGPALPEGVTLHTGGRHIPLELVYQGQDADGLHVWAAVLTPVLAEGGGVVEVRRLPPRTSMVVWMREDDTL